MSDTVAQFLSNYSETVPVPEHLPLTCLVWYLFLEFDNQKHRAEQLKSLFYGYDTPDYFKMLEDTAHQEKPMRDCLEAARQAAIEAKIEQYDQDYDFERFERNKLKTPKFYTVSFLAWAEGAGYPIPEYISKELGERVEYYFHGQNSRNEERHKFPEIDKQEFERRTNEPLWRITDAILYALGYQSRTNEETKIGFLRYKNRAKRLIGYVFDAQKANDLSLYDFDDHLLDVDQKDAEEKRIKSLYASKVKPKEFVIWLEGLALDIPILEGKIGQPPFLNPAFGS